MPNIMLLTSGTRGDIQPLVALGLGLQGAGHNPQFVTHAPFQRLVSDRGLPFAELDGDLIALLTSPQWRSALIYDGNPLRSVRSTSGYLRAARPIYARMLASAWQHAQSADAIIASLPTAVCASQIAVARGIPYMLALLQPIGRTRHFPSPMLPFIHSLGPLNRLSHLAIELTLWLPWRTELQRWRQQTLGLAALPFAGPFAEPLVRNTQRLYGFSQQIVPRPVDWPVSWDVTGYWYLDHPVGQHIPADLHSFLERGPAPIYLGLGSMAGGRQIQVQQMAEDIVKYTGRRVVIVTDSVQPEAQHNRHIYVSGPIWHDLIFPHMALAIHHGGAGTTAAALRAGIPNVILPIGIDQFFWGQRLAHLGCAPRPVAQHTITAAQLAALIQQAETNAIRERVAALGMQIRTEDGVGRAVERWNARAQERKSAKH